VAEFIVSSEGLVSLCLHSCYVLFLLVHSIPSLMCCMGTELRLLGVRAWDWQIDRFELFYFITT